MVQNFNHEVGIGNHLRYVDEKHSHELLKKLSISENSFSG